LVEAAAAGREQDDRGLGEVAAQRRLDGGDDRRRLHHHPGAAAVGCVVGGAVAVGRPVAEVVDAEVEQPTSRPRFRMLSEKGPSNIGGRG
jgi:hypothetical protein